MGIDEWYPLQVNVPAKIGGNAEAAARKVGAVEKRSQYGSVF